MNDVGGAVRDVGAFDPVSELPLIQPGSRRITQRRHPQIAEMRANAQPVDLFRGLDLPQTDVVAAQAFRLAKLRRQGRVLFGRDHAHCCHAIFASPPPLKRFYGLGNRRFATPRDIGPIGKDRRLRCMIDVLHE